MARFVVTLGTRQFYVKADTADLAKAEVVRRVCQPKGARKGDLPLVPWIGRTAPPLHDEISVRSFTDEDRKRVEQAGGPDRGSDHQIRELLA